MHSNRCEYAGVDWLLSSVSWPSLLLLLQFIVSPTTVRSRRNYNEGLLFCVATVLLVMVWAAWLSFYILQPFMEELAVSAGLTLCPTVLIIAVFIPKTFFIAKSLGQPAHDSKDKFGVIGSSGANLAIPETSGYQSEVNRITTDTSPHLGEPHAVYFEELSNNVTEF